MSPEGSAILAGAAWLVLAWRTWRTERQLARHQQRCRGRYLEGRGDRASLREWANAHADAHDAWDHCVRRSELN